MTAAAHILPLLLAVLPWEVEAGAWAVYHGADPLTAIAVANTETGNLCRPIGSMCPDRITDVSLGNYGIMQINCPTWRDYLTRDCNDFLYRHRNLFWGTYILARFQAKYRPQHGDGCRLHGKAHHWTCHYNAGHTCHERSVRYGRRVLEKLRRMATSGK